MPSAAYGSPAAIGNSRSGAVPSGRVLGGGSPGGGVLEGVSTWIGRGIGTAAPGRLAAANGCSSGGGWVTGRGSAGGGSAAPGRAAALSGWISGGGGFFAAGPFGGVGRAYVGTGVKVVCGCGGAPAGVPPGVVEGCAGFLRRLLFVES
jgi:hypothetical protein